MVSTIADTQEMPGIIRERGFAVNLVRDLGYYGVIEYHDMRGFRTGQDFQEKRLPSLNMGQLVDDEPLIYCMRIEGEVNTQPYQAYVLYQGNEIEAVKAQAVELIAQAMAE